MSSSRTASSTPALSADSVPTVIDRGAVVEVGTLVDILSLVADPRARRGVRHCLSGLLGAGIAAALAGARSFTAIAQWAVEPGTSRLATLGLEVTAVPTWITFPGATQIAQVRRTVTRAGKKTVEIVYVITSADHRSAPPPVLAAWIQGHWSIENRLHWVRDVVYDEDRSQIRTGHGPVSWPPSARPPSACTASPEPPTSPPRYATTPATQTRS